MDNIKTLPDDLFPDRYRIIRSIDVGESYISQVYCKAHPDGSMEIKSYRVIKNETTAPQGVTNDQAQPAQRLL